MTKYLQGNSYAHDLKAIRDYLHWYNTMIDLIARETAESLQRRQLRRHDRRPCDNTARSSDLCELDEPDSQVPVPGHDRDCSAPYLDLMGRA